MGAGVEEGAHISLLPIRSRKTRTSDVIIYSTQFDTIEVRYFDLYCRLEIVTEEEAGILHEEPTTTLLQKRGVHRQV